MRRSSPEFWTGLLLHVYAIWSSPSFLPYFLLDWLHSFMCIQSDGGTSSIRSELHPFGVDFLSCRSVSQWRLPFPRTQTQLLIDSGPTFSFCLSRFYVLGSAMGGRAGRQALWVCMYRDFLCWGWSGQVRSSWTPSHYVAPHPSM